MTNPKGYFRVGRRKAALGVSGDRVPWGKMMGFTKAAEKWETGMLIQAYERVESFQGSSREGPTSKLTHIVVDRIQILARCWMKVILILCQHGRLQSIQAWKTTVIQQRGSHHIAECHHRSDILSLLPDSMG